MRYKSYYGLILIKKLKEAQDLKKKTTWNFFYFLIELRTSLFQDIAYLYVMNEDYWLLYTALFKNEKFIIYAEEYKEFIKRKENSDNINIIDTQN